MLILYDLHFIWIDTVFVSVFERRAEIHQILIFGGHLGRHLRKYATDVIDFYIFTLYDLHFIWIDTLFVFVSERTAEIHSIQNFGGHVGRHLGKKNFTYFQIPDHICDIPVKFGWNIRNSSEVITISFGGSKKTPKWPSCDFFRIWPTRVKIDFWSLFTLRQYRSYYTRSFGQLQLGRSCMCSQKEGATEFETSWFQEIPFSKKLTNNYW